MKMSNCVFANEDLKIMHEWGIIHNGNGQFSGTEACRSCCVLAGGFELI